MKRSIHVTIAGQDLALRSDEGTEYVQQLANYVDEKLRELTLGRKSLSPQRVALLVALQITDELFRQKDLNQRFRQRVDAQLKVVEAALAQHELRIEELDEPDHST